MLCFVLLIVTCHLSLVTLIRVHGKYALEGAFHNCTSLLRKSGD
jgi:hypothetical protein